MTMPATTAKHDNPAASTVIIVFLSVKPEARERFNTMLSEIAEHIAREPDFVSATVHRDMDDPDTIVLYETWASSRDHLIAHHLSKPYRKAYEAALSEMLKSERRIICLEPLRHLVRDSRTAS